MCNKIYTIKKIVYSSLDENFYYEFIIFNTKEIRDLTFITLAKILSEKIEEGFTLSSITEEEIFYTIKYNKFIHLKRLSQPLETETTDERALKRWVE
ncbi:MAG: hypothetical protein ACRC0V_08455 [Fusobacteriaceae bacterium]